MILTNDTDFLDPGAFPGVKVLLYTDNRTPAHELATLVEKLTEYYPSQNDLPREFYLTEGNV